MIAVTGATGHVGSHVVALLHGRGTPVRALVRDRSRAVARLGAGVELAVGDFEDAASLHAAFAGADALFLASPNHPRQAEHEVAAIDAARAAGVRRIVKLSAIGAEIGSPLSFWDHHGRSEAHLADSGVPAVILRPSAYMQYLLASAGQIREHGALFAPLAGAANALIDIRDVAAIAALALTGTEHVGRTYVLTGPELLPYDRIASEIGVVIGRPVAFVAVPDDAAHAAMLASAMPPWLADQLIIMMQLQRAGAAATVTDTVHRLTGRAPRSWRDFVREHAAAFQSPTSAPQS